MHHFSFSIPVGTTPMEMLAFIPSDTISVAIYAEGAVEIGVGGVTIGTGYPISAGGSFGFNHQDFGYDSDVVRLHAVAAVATTVRIFGFRRD